MPNNGIETNTVDFIGPCSRLLSPATPLPDTALRVYRQTLAAQADGTVVISAVGYSENLAALLDSPPDTISPLSGRELIARKVKLLSIMAGGYPSRSVENNLAGNPAAAQDLAVNWPGKISWSGYEVGDAVHTGTTISRTHPISSPVRVSYEAFVGPNNWIYSYDLTAVYHAVRPNDSLLTEVGPGINTVTSTGGNYFTAGPGNQFYLRLSDATALDAAIEALLDTLPTVLPADTTAPVVSGVGVGSVTVSGALVTWTTDEVSDSQVEYGPSSTYGTTSPLNPTAVVSHSLALSGLSAATTYHFRVRSRDAVGNVGLSNDVTFQTHGTPPLLLNETFDANVIDPTKWLAVTGGSTVVAANQQLEISHPPGPWTTGSLQSVTPHDQTNRVLQLQLKRAANNGLGGTTFGETSVFLWRDPTHYAEFFIAGGSLTALMNGGSGEVNLTPSWPGYSATSNQWVRFRESAGTLYWEYADGTTTPGTWTTMASASNPFAMDSVVVKMIAGANVNVVDTAMLDNVALI